MSAEHMEARPHPNADAGDGESFEEVSRTKLLREQQSSSTPSDLPIADITVLKSELPEARAVFTGNDIPQKPLRSWRYFNFGAVNPAHKERKPCYICGKFSHLGRKCPKRRACYLCKEKGHFAAHCPVNLNETERICLRCGETGHEIFACNNDYFLDDLKKVNCYICNQRGHILCGNDIAISSATLSCYICGKFGHSGSVHSSSEDITACTLNLLHTHNGSVPVEGVDLSLACPDQDAAVGSNSMNIGVYTSSSSVYAGDGELFDEVTRSVLLEETHLPSPPQPPSSANNVVLRLELPEAKCIVTKSDVPQKLHRGTCYVCKGKDHFAVHCPMTVKESERICLRCGERGHEIFSCNNEYSPDDLKNIHCYGCNEFGHIFCGNGVDVSASTSTCYNCGERGHSGLQCPKPGLDKKRLQPPSICYKCGEVGHSARKCDQSTEVSRCYKSGQDAASQLEVATDDVVSQKPKRAWRSKKYSRYRVKKRKAREVLECMTVQ